MTDLLDYLVEKTRVDYMSDLKMSANLKSTIMGIEPMQFPLKDWNQAIQYLCKTKITFEDADEARQFLIDYKL